MRSQENLTIFYLGHYCNEEKHSVMASLVDSTQLESLVADMQIRGNRQQWELGIQEGGRLEGRQTTF